MMCYRDPLIDYLSLKNADFCSIEQIIYWLITLNLWKLDFKIY